MAKIRITTQPTVDNTGNVVFTFQGWSDDDAIEYEAENVRIPFETIKDPVLRWTFLAGLEERVQAHVDRVIRIQEAVAASPAIAAAVGMTFTDEQIAAALATAISNASNP